MKEKLHELTKKFEEKYTNSNTIEQLEGLKVEFIGRNGKLTEILKSIKDLPEEERADIGKLANIQKKNFDNLINEKIKKLKYVQLEKKLVLESIDVTLPGRTHQQGKVHIINQTIELICNAFATMGFDIKTDNEIEDEFHNFEALNIPEHHPVRDEQDSFFLDNGLLLRTHTSPVQIRVMEDRKPPLAFIAPGKCYRRDALDATHLTVFHQVEGLLVDKDVRISHLKGVLENFVHQVFSQKTKIRFRAGYFPFTEPSAEVDISCIFCDGKGCNVCKTTGWIEILGSGMVHPNVFKAVGYDPAAWKGLAFGMGVERVAMLLYNINDMRLFMENQIDFLDQF